MSKYRVTLYAVTPTARYFRDVVVDARSYGQAQNAACLRVAQDCARIGVTLSSWRIESTECVA